MIRPVRWTGDALELLDQTRLPREEVWLRCTAPEQVADAIRRLAVRGAPAIGIAAAFGAVLGLRRGDDPASVGELLGSTRPTAVNLRWALDRVLAAEDPLAAAERIHADQEASDDASARHGAALFDATHPERVLTHCNAGALATGGCGSALGVVLEASRQGKVAHVWVDETRPLLQGARLTAYELRAAGVPHQVVTDSSAGILMARGLVDRVVVGADRIAANGDVANKIGTYPLAVLARHHGIPFTVVAPRSTVDQATPTGEQIPIEERDPAEVTTDAPAFNPAFDVTPAELVSAIVTEQGVHRAPYERSLK